MLKISNNLRHEFGQAISTPCACFFGREKSKIPCKRRAPVRAHLEEIDVWQGNHENGSPKCPRKLPNKGIFKQLLDEWKMAARNYLFSLYFLILSSTLSGFWVRNRPRAPRPSILIERQAADLGVFLGKSPPETINIP